MSLFAARSHADPTVTLVGIVVLFILTLVIIARESTAEWHLLNKGGLPYCPRCNRQVSLRREFCRACGYRFKTYGAPKLGSTTARVERSAEAEQQGRHRAGLRAKLRAKHRAERDKAYRAKGVEPGPWAWFKVLPDVTQAILLGMAFAIPAVVLLILAFLALSR